MKNGVYVLEEIISKWRQGMLLLMGVALLYFVTIFNVVWHFYHKRHLQSRGIFYYLEK